MCYVYLHGNVFLLQRGEVDERVLDVHWIIFGLHQERGRRLVRDPHRELATDDQDWRSDSGHRSASFTSSEGPMGRPAALSPRTAIVTSSEGFPMKTAFAVLAGYVTFGVSAGLLLVYQALILT
jgi:hypothetical protein